jgi:MFS transporter, DHA1 family, tetracycline resistance protein
MSNLSIATYLLVFSVLADISNPINRAKTFGLIGAAYALSYFLQIPIQIFFEKLIDSGLSYFSLLLLSLLSLINFFIILFFYKETNINIGTKTNFFEYFKILSDPMIWSLLLITGVYASYITLFRITLDLQNYSPNQISSLLIIGLIITFIVQGFLIGPLTNIFLLNQIILFGLICVIISLIFYYFLNKQSTNNTISVQTILLGIFSIGINLVLPCLYALIINKYNYINYGTIIGFLIVLIILSDGLITSFINIPSFYSGIVQSLLMITSLILFLISKKSGVNLIT